jgi:hypothetical protein
MHFTATLLRYIYLLLKVYNLIGPNIPYLFTYQRPGSLLSRVPRRHVSNAQKIPEFFGSKSCIPFILLEFGHPTSRGPLLA